ncbi:MAG: type II secretion system protein, partial [Shewanella sp.]|nr:type II secretion system protein [Shewanella sp.]
LATTAIPKFVNLQSDARVSTLNALKGAISSGNSLVYSKALLKGVQKSPSSSVNMGNGVNVATQYGYIAPSNTALAGALDINMQLAKDANPTADWLYYYEYRSEAGTVSTVGVFIRQNGAPDTNCDLKYIPANTSSAPKFEMRTSGC